MKPIKIIFLDTETTSLDPVKGGIHQLAGKIVIDGQLADSFDFRIRPFRDCEINPESLKVSNTDVLDLMKCCEEFQIAYQLSAVLGKHIDYSDNDDKFILAGWRLPEFDMLFLKQFFKRNFPKQEFDRLFWSSPIDVKSLAVQHLIAQRDLFEHFHLDDVASHLVIPVVSSLLHSANYDAELCWLIYKKITGL